MVDLSPLPAYFIDFVITVDDYKRLALLLMTDHHH